MADARPFDEVHALISDSTGGMQFPHALLIDCILSDTHEFESEVTQYPVESGSNIVDNVRPKPIKITMEGIVSSSPIGSIATQRSSNSIDDPIEYAYEFLMKIRDTRLPVTIRTSLSTYFNMVMENLSIARSSATADVLRFTATFLQITTVSNKRSTIRTATPSGQGQTKTSKPLDKNAGTVAICPNALQWFDRDIDGWRNNAQWISGTATADPNLKDGKWQLTKWTPAVSQAEWNLYAGTRYPPPPSAGQVALGVATLSAGSLLPAPSTFNTSVWNSLPETGTPSKQDLEQFLATRRGTTGAGASAAVSLAQQVKGPSAVIFVTRSDTFILRRS